MDNMLVLRSIWFKTQMLCNGMRVAVAACFLLLNLLVAKANGNIDESFSGTLPVLYIDTDGETPITEKGVYIDGSYYLDALGIDGYESIGSREKPLRLKIKGRGNWTWETYDKKPYRIKLEQKKPLMGMNESKHFVLLAHAEDYYGYLREGTAFELSRRIGLSFTPDEEPIEVVLNGDYIGLYFLTEQIRVDKDRVNIIEQDDYETDSVNVTGGWLIEIDAYPDENPIILSSRDGFWFPVSLHSPEELSDVQYNYLVNYINTIDSLIYESDSLDCEWANYLDMDSMACYYLVNEVMDNIEAFSGSCYLHKQRGDTAKLIFGPVWDFGNSYNRDELTFIYDNSKYLCHWLNGVLRFPAFRHCVKEHWHEFYDNGLRDIDNFIDQYQEHIKVACESNNARWPEYAYDELDQRKANFKEKMHQKIAFLNGQFNDTKEVIADSQVIKVEYVDLYGHISNQPFSGLNIIIKRYDDGHMTTEKVIRK